MTIFNRAAALVVMTFSLAALTGISTPGIAAGQGQVSAPGRITPAVLVQTANDQAPADQTATAQVAPFAARSAPVLPERTPFDDAAAVEPSRFATLAAAVAAQDPADADEATRCLAGAIYFESKGEPIDGQLAVAEVVMNRAKSGRFPADVCGVVRQPGQFSFVHAGTIPDVDTSRANYRTALSVAKVAMANDWASSAPHALFFHARRVGGSARWVKVAAIGNHVFYR